MLIDKNAISHCTNSSGFFFFVSWQNKTVYQHFLIIFCSHCFNINYKTRRNPSRHRCILQRFYHCWPRLPSPIRHSIPFRRLWHTNETIEDIPWLNKTWPPGSRWHLNICRLPWCPPSICISVKVYSITRPDRGQEWTWPRAWPC